MTTVKRKVMAFERGRQKRSWIGGTCGAALGLLSGVTYSRRNGWGYDRDFGLRNAQTFALIGWRRHCEANARPKRLIAPTTSCHHVSDTDKEGALSFGEIQLDNRVDVSVARMLFEKAGANKDNFLQPHEICGACFAQDQAIDYRMRLKRCGEEDEHDEPDDGDTYIIYS